MAKKQIKTAAQALFPDTQSKVTEMTATANTEVVIEEKTEENAVRRTRVLRDKKVFVLLDLTYADGTPVPKGEVSAKMIGSYTVDQVDDVMAARDEHPNAHHFTISIKMAKD